MTVTRAPVHTAGSQL